jgi:hypothetical protein
MTKKPTSSKRGGKSKSTPTANQDIEKHLSKIKEIHPELRKLVNRFLEEKNIPLKVGAMHFTSEAEADYGCCTINGMVVCGPQCP